MPETLFDKLWRAHEICQLSDQQSLIYVDRIVLHERTGSIALASLAARGRAVRQRRHAFCTMDHIIDTTPGRNDNTRMPGGRDFIIATRTAAQEMDITLFDINDPDQGIVHVISPELGIAQPGATLVCPDSHTCSLGGLGALAWGVGSTEATHALATSTLRVRRPGNHRIQFVGDLPAAATAKDMILFVIRELSAAGGAGPTSSSTNVIESQYFCFFFASVFPELPHAACIVSTIPITNGSSSSWSSITPTRALS